MARLTKVARHCYRALSPCPSPGDQHPLATTASCIGLYPHYSPRILLDPILCYTGMDTRGHQSEVCGPVDVVGDTRSVVDGFAG